MGLASYQRLIFDPDGDLLLLLSSQSCAGHEVEGDSTAGMNELLATNFGTLNTL